MAAERPVVATDVGGAREAVVEGETGFLVRAGDDEAMAERIAALLRDADKRRAMGERGRRIVEEKFSCEAQLRRTESLYERLLARARGDHVGVVLGMGREPSVAEASLGGGVEEVGARRVDREPDRRADLAA